MMEMVIVISIMGIVGVMIAMMAGRQMEGYVALSRRAALVASGGAVITHLERDIRNALPNSVRISGTVLELIPVLQTLRYREADSSLANSDRLDFSVADARFQLLGSLASLPVGARLVIYNTSLLNGSAPLAGMNIYGAASGGPSPPAGAHVVTPSGTAFAIAHDATGDFITLTPGHQFALASPQKRMYVVTTALAYRCDTAARVITRYRNYGIQTSQPVTAAQFTALGATSGRVASRVSACSFSYQTGAAQQSALVTIHLTLEDAGESIDLLHQIHVDNAI